MNLFIYQLKQAFAGLKQKPGLVSNLVLTLGLTVGALICALTLTYFMLFKPLPYPSQEQLFLLNNQLTNAEGVSTSKGFSYKQAEYLYQHKQGLEAVSLIYNVSDVISSHTLQPNLHTAYVTHEWFQLLDVPFALGHGLEKSQGFNQFVPSAVISYATWQQYYHGAPDILNETMEIRGVTYKIIGVTAAHHLEPEIFSTGRKAEIWLPWDFNWSQQMNWGDWEQIENNIQVLAKTTKNSNAKMDIYHLQNQLQIAWQEQMTDSPQYRNWALSLSLTPIIEAIFGEQNKLVFYILFACLGIFIIAIANTANLLLSRTFEKASSFFYLCCSRRK